MDCRERVETIQASKAGITLDNRDPGNWIEGKNRNYQTGDDEEVITTHHLEAGGITGGDSDGSIQSGYLAKQECREGSMKEAKGTGREAVFHRGL